MEMTLKELNTCFFESKILFNNGQYKAVIQKISVIIKKMKNKEHSLSKKEYLVIFNLYRQLYDATLLLKDKKLLDQVLADFKLCAEKVDKQEWLDYEILEAQLCMVDLEKDKNKAIELMNGYRNIMEKALAKNNDELTIWAGNKYLKLMYFAGQYTNFEKVSSMLIDLSLKLIKKEALLWIYHHLGMIYLGLQDEINAKKYFEYSLDISYELNQKDGVVWNSYNLGMIAAEKDGNKDQVADYFFQAITASNETDDIDESHKKMLKSYLPQLNAHLLHFNKLALSSKILLSEVHELKNFLTGSSLEISNLKFLLAQEDNISPEINEFIANIYQSNKQVVEKVKNILQFVRRKELSLGSMETSLNYFMDTFIQRTNTLVRDNQIELIIKNNIIDQDKELPIADNVLYQTLLNLLLNSIEAMADKNDKKVELIINSENDHCEIIFKDNGPGIPLDKKDSIFDAFYTTKEDGTGLGLYIIRKMLNEFGGNIELAESFPATFKITVL